MNGIKSSVFTPEVNETLQRFDCLPPEALNKIEDQVKEYFSHEKVNFVTRQCFSDMAVTCYITTSLYTTNPILFTVGALFATKRIYDYFCPSKELLEVERIEGLVHKSKEDIEEWSNKIGILIDKHDLTDEEKAHLLFAREIGLKQLGKNQSNVS